MDADIAALVSAERLADAAKLATSRGDHALAVDLYERACAFAPAAEAALLANRDEHALMLACLGADDALAERALARLSGEATLARVGLTLAQRGHHAWAARALEASGRAGEAAEQWALGGRADRAAELFERLGEPISAARELEAALRKTPTRHDLRLLLGRLLLRHGRTEPGVRVLQGIDPDAPERAPALVELVRAFEALGLKVAANDAEEELTKLGGAPSTRRASEPPPAALSSTSAARARLYGRYEITREISSTASARVLECIDVLTQNRVALKIFAGSGLRGVGRDALARFEREVSILRTLRHPSVVPLVAYVPEGPALALAWMPGGTLAEMLGQDIPAPARAVEIAAAVLDALAAAHRAGVIHRDIKPSNVLFDGAGVARLSDFGAAHLGDLAATATAGVIGTFAYMSPEQREGRPATIRSDLYSVGIMLNEMLTGQPPVALGDRAQPSAAHRDLGAPHDALLARLTAADPEERPRDALEARRLLLSLTWPTAHEPIARPAATPEPERVIEQRLEPIVGDLYRDRWTGRRVRVVALSPRAVQRARAFALSGHVGLAAVLRVDSERNEIWIEDLDGGALDRPLTKDENVRFERALASLHEAGIAHGHVDAAHVRITSRFGAVLLFEPDAAPTATPDLDRLNLAALRGDRQGTQADQS